VLVVVAVGAVVVVVRGSNNVARAAFVGLLIEY